MDRQNITYTMKLKEGGIYLAILSRKTATYKKISDIKGHRYRFFCDLSGAFVCESEAVYDPQADEELSFAWSKFGRKFFNQCHSCGRWVSDPMYNADVLQCVDCVPWENVPKYCSRCGNPVSMSDSFCGKCGMRLQYGEVMTDEGQSIGD